MCNALFIFSETHKTIQSSSIERKFAKLLIQSNRRGMPSIAQSPRSVQALYWELVMTSTTCGEASGAKHPELLMPLEDKVGLGTSPGLTGGFVNVPEQISPLAGVKNPRIQSEPPLRIRSNLKGKLTGIKLIKAAV